MTIITANEHLLMAFWDNVFFSSLLAFFSLAVYFERNWVKFSLENEREREEGVMRYLW
jgi:hypothetical protein